jgi:hypothetical protein
MKPIISPPHGNSRSRRQFLQQAGAFTVAGLAGSAVQAATPSMPLFDTHLHYSHDAWERLPPPEAVAVMRAAGLRRAMVSSSSDEGTQMLFKQAPDLVVPVLRPYRRRGELGSWVRDDSIIAHMEGRLAKYRYAGIGEYHVYGADADLPVMRRVVQFAREAGLLLHSHGDADGVERQFAQWPEARILWAHAGFDGPKRVQAMLAKYPRLWIDLAFRSDHAVSQLGGTKVEPAWRELFLAYPDRATVGTDTFTPERWHFVGDHARWSREWLADLPKDVAERIGWKNGDALLASLPTPWKQPA